MEPTTHPSWDRQVELEQRMTGLGKDRYKSNVERAVSAEQETATRYGSALLKAAIAPLSAAIREFVRESLAGKPGRRATAAKYLDLLDSDTAAALTAKVVIDTITAINPTAQNVAMRVAGAVQDEVRFRYYRSENRAFYDAIMRDQQKRGKRPDHIRRVIVFKMNKTDVEWEAWPASDSLHLGWKLLELLVETTGLVEITHEGGTRVRTRTTYRVKLTPETDAWIKSFNSMNELLTPAYLPTVIPPKPWTSVEGGGYWTDAARPLLLVKSRNPEYIEQLSKTTMPVVYEAINAIQATPWKINTPVLNTLIEAWDAALEVGSLPPRDDRELPAKPHDIETNEEARRAWKRVATRVYDFNEEVRSKRFQVAKTIWVAAMFRDDPAIYFPYQMDFRSRVYSVAMFLNPQGPDYAKALLTFAEGKPINDREAADWLAIHGANVYGYDKASLRERVQWTVEHGKEIVACAADPLGNRFWSDADKPWQFLAFCFEWAEFLKVGYGFVSSLPIALDGTCNGLQHFSAMLRDDLGGAAVNLVPSDKPQDIYQRVADVTVSKLKEKLTDLAFCEECSREAWNRPVRAEDCTHVENGQAARHWLAFGISRKTTKRSVMVLPYGGTLYSCRQYVRDHVEERTQEGEKHAFNDDLGAAVAYLSKTIWESIGDVVVAARSAMGWLQEVAKVVTSEKKPITWVTPAGFPVMQHYPHEKMREIKTQLFGRIVKLTLREQLETIDPKRQVTGISPNFVHSMDAAALMRSVVKAKAQGIDSFAMIHDSYGTVAADTQKMGRALREAFVEMYQQHDVLVEFRESVLTSLRPGVEIPPIPTKGDLKIEDVLQSEFFFA